jgi:hypothetical protein
MDLFGDVQVNPLLCALEGGHRSSPSYDEFVQEFEQASAAISRDLPHAKLLRFAEPHFRAAYDFVMGLHRHSRPATAFLLQVAPILAPGVSTKDLRAVEEQLLTLARQHGLATTSLSVVAALSCLYESNAATSLQVGRDLLKPAQLRSEADSYNVLADLHAVEIALQSRRLAPGEAWHLCTRDRGLAGLWCGLQLGQVRETGATPEFVAKPTRALFPRLTEWGVARLSRRLLSG